MTEYTKLALVVLASWVRQSRSSDSSNPAHTNTLLKSEVAKGPDRGLSVRRSNYLLLSTIMTTSLVWRSRSSVGGDEPRTDSGR